MTPPEFCYWLQGAIEIGGLQRIDDRQKQLIMERLNQVDEVRPFHIAAEYIFNHYPLDIAFPAISKELQRIFQHDIDPNYEGDQEFLYAVHQGEVTPENAKSGS